ncbi:MAG: response regulator [Candidatus Zapsychrus exili]|nr:response regulator [Candidatus Zapsychrus exili]
MELETNKKVRGKKILIVDDERDLLDVLATRFRANGYETVTAENGAEGLKVWQEEKPDLIVLDIMMPGMDGYTFLQELKTIDNINPIPIIMLTAKQDMEEIFQVEGVAAYMTKPFDTEELLGKIADLLK